MMLLDFAGRNRSAVVWLESCLCEVRRTGPAHRRPAELERAAATGKLLRRQLPGYVRAGRDFHQLAAQEAALARAAVTNESRAHHYAMAAYYTRLAEAKEKIAVPLE